VVLPRILIAGVHSGVGKTTVTAGLVGALRARGLRVAAFKCGPDYLDPTYLALAASSDAPNLDGWMMGPEAVLATFADAAAGADLAVIEGMMGLHDGATPTSAEGSTAEIARWLGAPVLLVCDASGLARSLAALAQGYARFDPEVTVAGVIANRVGGAGHLDLLRQALTEPPLVGGLPADRELALPERHLGLLRAEAVAGVDERLRALAAVLARWIDLDAVLAIARRAAPLPTPAATRSAASSRRCRIGLARDEAFHFYYPENLRRLERAGAELVPFSPCRDAALPDVDGLYIGGGYPEAQAAELAANQGMQAAIRGFAAAGGPIYAECGGLMLLARGIRTVSGQRHPMVGLLPVEVTVHERLCALGYVEVQIRAPSLLGPAGTRFRGHQFRYSELTLDQGVAPDCVYQVQPRWGGHAFAEGYQRGGVLASYVHAHFASCPELAEALVAACAVRSTGAAASER
jgi:cobyrinic acid a,c-diamide synthase